MVDALHRDGGIRYPATLGVPHNTFDPTMRLQTISTGQSNPPTPDTSRKWTPAFTVWCVLFYRAILLSFADFEPNETLSSPHDLSEYEVALGAAETL